METYNQLLRAEYIKYWETKKRKRLNDGELWEGVGAGLVTFGKCARIKLQTEIIMHLQTVLTDLKNQSWGLTTQSIPWKSIF